MVIQHNIPALNSHRNLLVNNSATAKNLEKLSSGYRINRAGDDAAGLAISEKMRGQIRGLAMAENNVSMGINLIQTAEGGLQETHAILQRMRELAVQASNGTYDDDDRANLQMEIRELNEEIDRIAESTAYNGINLLDGSYAEFNDVLDTTGTATTPASATNIFTATPVAGDVTGDTLLGETFTLTAAIDAKGNFTITQTGGGDDYIITAGAGGAWTVEHKTSNVQISFTLNEAIFGNSAVGDLAEADFTYTTAGTTVPGPPTLGGFASRGVGAAITNQVAGSAVTFQIGCNGGADQMLDVHIEDMSAAALGVLGINIADPNDANRAIDTISDATNTVSAQRAQLGAYQNRLEHTLNNLGVTKENLTASESTIRDVDMAKEMMEFTKNNILVQSAQAMLAQATQLPQGVLQLLR